MSGSWFTSDGMGGFTPASDSTDGADSYAGDPTGNDFFVSGGDGNDTLDGKGGEDVLFGADGNDELLGGDDNDELQGGSGDDVLRGGDGNDFLSGIPGSDRHFGGAGVDTVQLDGFAANATWTWNEAEQGWYVTYAGEPASATDFVAGDIEWVTYQAIGESALTPCYLAGTRTLTEAGEVPAEALRSGDRVVTLALNGPRLAAIRWVGHRSLDPRCHPAPEKVLPIRIAAGALGGGVPWRDLLVSPDHALLVDGVLVPAALLLGLPGIRQEPALGPITYHHVELDAHDVLLAEGTPAESYLDCDNRHQFANGGLHQALHPDFARAGRPASAPCASLVLGGDALERIRARLAGRAASVRQRRAA